MPGQQTEDGGHKDHGKNCADPAQKNGEPLGARMHPGPADADQPEGQKKGGETEGLQEQVAEPCAEEAGPVAHGVGQA